MALFVARIIEVFSECIDLYARKIWIPIKQKSYELDSEHNV